VFNNSITTSPLIASKVSAIVASRGILVFMTTLCSNDANQSTGKAQDGVGVGDGKSDSKACAEATQSNHLLAPFLDQKANSTKTDQTPTQWTVAVDLGIAFDQVGPHGHLGAEEKLQALEQLKESTKGKPVTIVVEALIADGKDVPGQNLSQSKKPYDVERIVLRDGEETIVSSGPSKGLKDDLQDFLDFALTQQPGNKVALAINAHGLGDQGIAGGMQEEPGRQNGTIVSANDLAGVIKSSLAKSGHEKLDLLDLDSCLMGQMGVLQQMNPVSKQLVASEETETAGLNPGQIDGQNLTSWIADIIAKPGMTGFEVGQDIIQRANQGLNGQGTTEGTRTLAHYDLQNHFGEFSQDLNGLGEKLTEALKSPDNREQINRSIDLISDVAASGDHKPALPSTIAKRDIGGFLNLLAMNIDGGRITDPDHQLRQAIFAVQGDLQDRTKLLSAAHLPQATGLAGKPVINYTSNEGGLSVFLPNMDVRTNSALPEAQLEKLYETEAGTTDGGWLNFLRSLRQAPKEHSIFSP
jgi:hypothetical protein